MYISINIENAQSKLAQSIALKLGKFPG